MKRCFCLFVLGFMSVANVASASSSFFSALLSQVQALRTVVQSEQPPTAGLDFSEVDATFQSFLDDSPVFDGISYVVVDANATLHTATFGDHSEDLVVMLASTSKVPAVMTLLALDEDPNVSFTMDQPVSTMLPYEGVYTDRTITQMVSNTSGIPGLQALADYGNPFGQTLETLNHLCTFAATEAVEFEACGKQLLTNELANSQPAGDSFDYGGSQWQAAGVTASIAANSTWNQLVDQYLGVPCGLEVFTFGNPWQELNFGETSFNGTVESLPGQHQSTHWRRGHHQYGGLR